MIEERTLILGASKGLGKCIADQCHARGEKTLELSRSAQEDLHGDRWTCNYALEAPPVDPDFLLKVRINRFFWVAGQHLQGPLAEQSACDTTNIVDVNFRNALILAQLIWQMMVKGESPCTYTVISSTSGTRARKNEAVYAATKHAQVGFTRSLGLEAQGTNINVSLFMPGGMQTAMWSPTMPGLDQFLDPAKVAERILQRVHGQRENYYEEEIPRGSL